MPDCANHLTRADGLWIVDQVAGMEISASPPASIPHQKTLSLLALTNFHALTSSRTSGPLTSCRNNIQRRRSPQPSVHSQLPPYQARPVRAFLPAAMHLAPHSLRAPLNPRPSYRHRTSIGSRVSDPSVLYFFATPVDIGNRQCPILTPKKAAGAALGLIYLARPIAAMVTAG